jgi:hypothetical protein
MAGAAAITMLAVPATASAHTGTQTSGTASDAKCNADWYVNPDETALKPKQLRSGLLFDGPSLIHHKTSGYTLKNVPTNGSFTAHVYAGARPLFKLETSNPYSTINKGAGGWWSSKIAASELGGQNQPVDSPADLIGKYTYTETTTVASFGVGYGNDTSNKALVASVRFGSHFYSLACRPHQGHPTPTPPATSTPTPTPTSTSPSGDGGGTPTSVPSGAPQTGDGSSGGANTALMAAGGLVVLLGGGTGLLMWRRRNQH